MPAVIPEGMLIVNVASALPPAATPRDRKNRGNRVSTIVNARSLL
jgi:hypothetical protein